MARNLLPAFGEAIRSRRLARGWTVERLAEESQLGINTVRSAEHGRPPNVPNLIAIADTLGATVGELLGEIPASIEAQLPGWSVLLTDERLAITQLVAAIALSRNAILALQHDRTEAEINEAITSYEAQVAERGSARTGLEAANRAIAERLASEREEIERRERADVRTDDGGDQDEQRRRNGGRA